MHGIDYAHLFANANPDAPIVAVVLATIQSTPSVQRVMTELAQMDPSECRTALLGAVDAHTERFLRQNADHSAAFLFLSCLVYGKKDTLVSKVMSDIMKTRVPIHSIATQIIDQILSRRRKSNVHTLKYKGGGKGRSNQRQRQSRRRRQRRQPQRRQTGGGFGDVLQLFLKISIIIYAAFADYKVIQSTINMMPQAIAVGDGLRSLVQGDSGFTQCMQYTKVPKMIMAVTHITKKVHFEERPDMAHTYGDIYKAITCASKTHLADAMSDILLNTGMHAEWNVDGKDQDDHEFPPIWEKWDQNAHKMSGMSGSMVPAVALTSQTMIRNEIHKLDAIVDGLVVYDRGKASTTNTNYLKTHLVVYEGGPSGSSIGHGRQGGNIDVAKTIRALKSFSDATIHDLDYIHVATDAGMGADVQADEINSADIASGVFNLMWGAVRTALNGVDHMSVLSIRTQVLREMQSRAREFMYNLENAQINARRGTETIARNATYLIEDLKTYMNACRAALIATVAALRFIAQFMRYMARIARDRVHARSKRNGQGHDLEYSAYASASADADADAVRVMDSNVSPSLLRLNDGHDSNDGHDGVRFLMPAQTQPQQTQPQQSRTSARIRQQRKPPQYRGGRRSRKCKRVRIRGRT